jgi:hypothetical protein
MAAIPRRSEPLAAGPTPLRVCLDDIRRDGRITDALTVAQALDPELQDWRYWGLLAATVAGLAELQAVLDAGYEADYRWRRLAGDAADVSAAAAGVRAARRGGLVLAGVLGELVGSGRGQLLGRINSALAAMMLAQVRLATAEIGPGGEAVRGLLGAVTAGLAARYVDALSGAAAVCPEEVAAAARPLLASPDAGPAAMGDVLADWRRRLQEAGARGQNRQEGNRPPRGEEPVAAPSHAGAGTSGGTGDSEDVYIAAGLLARQMVEEALVAERLASDKRASSQ